MRVCRPVLQILTLFRPKTVIFYSRFQTRPLKSKPFFRPGLQTEIMSSFFRLERKRTISPNAYPIRKFLLRSYSFGVETINKFIHPRSSIENHTRFQVKMGKEYTRFQTRKDKKTLHFWAVHVYMAYIGESPPPGGNSPSI